MSIYIYSYTQYWGFTGDFMGIDDDDLPSGKLLHNELDRSTMLCSWKNPRTFDWAMASIAFSLFTRPGIHELTRHTTPIG